MEKTAGVFSNTYVSETGKPYHVIGSFQSLPKLSSDNTSSSDVIKFQFCVIKDTPTVADIPQYYSGSVALVNGCWSYGQFNDEIFSAAKESPFTSWLKDKVIIAYLEQTTNPVLFPMFTSL